MASGDELLVTIPQGILRGQKEVSPFGDIYYSFQGIPYAKPPVGELRFKAPQPAEKWTGIRDATKPGSISPQSGFFTQGLIKDSNEDCLFVHVYTKKIPKPGKKYPVMAWIHGGGYTFGGGNKNFYSPDYFMRHDIVFVGINYRLGAFGFLSLQTLDCPGNNGLKDQRLALKWIQDNISYFGGNPDNVTLFGESAGSGSVHNHLLSPSSKGLFQKAICMSAVSNNPWAYQRQPRKNAYLLGKRLGCDAKNDNDLLDHLRKASAKDIIQKSYGILSELEGELSHEKLLNITFVPTCEPEHDDAVVTNRPLEGKYQADVPFITGNADKEMIMEIFSPKQVPQWTEDKEFQELIPRGFAIEKDSEKSVGIARKIREFYFKDGITLDAYLDALSDSYFIHGVHRAVKHRLDDKNIKSPTFLFLFSFDGNCPYVKTVLEMLTGTPVDIKGVAHADELSYYFTFQSPKFTIEAGSPEHKTILRATQLWVNFATTGMPTNEKSEVKWPPLKTSDDVYLDIGNELKLKKGLFKERMEFWDEIYKLAGEEL